MHVVSPYGIGAASYRERVHRWLQVTDTTATRLTYGDARQITLGHLVTHPVDILRHERELRRLRHGSPRRLLLLREASPFSRGELEKGLLTAAQSSVLDFDDALYEDWGHTNPVSRMFPKALKIRRCVSAADSVIAGNPTLADWASEFNPNVTMIPTCIDLKQYTQKVSFDLGEPPRLGWIGSPSTEQHLVEILPSLDAAFAQHPFVLEVVSGPSRRSPLDSRPYVHRRRWTPDVLADIGQWDVGLMPLKDSPYERGKCAYKLLQYAASALPAVASPVGVNAEILQSCGLHAPRTAGEWTEALLAVLAAPAGARERQGMDALRFVTASYTYDVWQGRWEAVALQA